MNLLIKIITLRLLNFFTRSAILYVYRQINSYGTYNEGNMLKIKMAETRTSEDNLDTLYCHYFMVKMLRRSDVACKRDVNLYSV